MTTVLMELLKELNTTNEEHGADLLYQYRPCFQKCLVFDVKIFGK